MSNIPVVGNIVAKQLAYETGQVNGTPVTPQSIERAATGLNIWGTETPYDKINRAFYEPINAAINPAQMQVVTDYELREREDLYTSAYDKALAEFNLVNGPDVDNKLNRQILLERLQSFALKPANISASLESLREPLFALDKDSYPVAEIIRIVQRNVSYLTEILSKVGEANCNLEIVRAYKRALEFRQKYFTNPAENFEVKVEELVSSQSPEYILCYCEISMLDLENLFNYGLVPANNSIEHAKLDEYNASYVIEKKLDVIFKFADKLSTKELRDILFTSGISYVDFFKRFYGDSVNEYLNCGFDKAFENFRNQRERLQSMHPYITGLFDDLNLLDCQGQVHAIMNHLHSQGIPFSRADIMLYAIQYRTLARKAIGSDVRDVNLLASKGRNEGYVNTSRKQDFARELKALSSNKRFNKEMLAQVGMFYRYLNSGTPLENNSLRYLLDLLYKADSIRNENLDSYKEKIRIFVTSGISGTKKNVEALTFIMQNAGIKLQDLATFCNLPIPNNIEGNSTEIISWLEQNKAYIDSNLLSIINKPNPLADPYI